MIEQLMTVGAPLWSTAPVCGDPVWTAPFGERVDVDLVVSTLIGLVKPNTPLAVVEAKDNNCAVGDGGVRSTRSAAWRGADREPSFPRSRPPPSPRVRRLKSPFWLVGFTSGSPNVSGRCRPSRTDSAGFSAFRSSRYHGAAAATGFGFLRGVDEPVPKLVPDGPPT